jgi:long-chain acyl-CoA synthetase
VLSPLPICYVYGASVVHTHLGVGATVVLSDMVYPQRTVDQMAEERVTGFAGVAWMYAALLSRTTFGHAAAPLPHLRYLMQAGSHMPAQDISRITTALPHADLFVMYGQTEATARITYLPPADLATHLGSVGLPVRDVQVEVRRPDGSLANTHESGEVYVSGPNVMMGYWQAADATRAVLTEDARGRWLRTGDVGRLDEEGYLYLEGRSSEMVKVWGHRVSLNEIEEVARLLPGVAEAAAVGVPHTLCGQAVHLVIVRDAGSALTSEQVLAHCRRQLSSFKMPQQVLFTDALPHTYTGKLQRRHLIGLTRVAS